MLIPGRFRRPLEGLRWPGGLDGGRVCSGGVAWQSNGGPGRLHPARAFPFTCDVAVGEGAGLLTGVELVGVLALHAGLRHEGAGAIGAVLQVVDGGGRVAFAQNLVHGKHYGDATDGALLDRVNGDGTRIRTVGSVATEGVGARVDHLRIELPQAVAASQVVLRDMGTAASFVLFDVFLLGEGRQECPFRGHGRKVGLGELGAILRLRDRVRFDQAAQQLREGIMRTEGDLDDARGTALTFLAVVSAGILELGLGGKRHRFQLDAARRLEGERSAEAVADSAVAMAYELVEGVLPGARSANDLLVDRAIQLMERSFGQDVSDGEVADRLGVSTSHFRHLFRERTGQPFHRFLNSMRLERARQQILGSETPISEIAREVGFQSAAHFSRAFSKRFGVSPSSLRTPGQVGVEGE